MASSIQSSADSSAQVPAGADGLSPWWRRTVVIVLVLGFGVLGWLAARTYSDAPPIPQQVQDPRGQIVFTGEEILRGQQVFLKYALMENGSIWGHGAYLGPDFSAAYLHELTKDVTEGLAMRNYNRALGGLTSAESVAVQADVPLTLKQNRYDTRTGTLAFTDEEVASYKRQVGDWTAYLNQEERNAGLPTKYISDSTELRELTAFVAWTAWASVANRPGKSHSYTNNFPYDPKAGNTPTGNSILWSALSLITLLGGTAMVLFAMGRFGFLGWKREGQHVHPHMIPGGATTESQKGTVKFFVLVALLFAAQAMMGGATAHARAHPGSFYGFDLAALFPSTILRTWHLQLMIFWVATAYVASGLFLAPALGGAEPKGQAKSTNLLFGALIVVAVGSLLGEYLGINRALGQLWFWLGHQGWEYLDLGRLWQMLLAVGLAFWVFLVFRGVKPARLDPGRKEISTLFLYAALAIPLFYLPAMFFSSTSHFSVVDMWRFWIIHLWVEGFFELFVTVMVAVVFFELGLITQVTAARVVYLDAILYLGSGIIGTGHHWYWTGQSEITMALAAVFSAMEVVPLTLLTLDAWDFIRLTQGRCDICGRSVSVPHKWTFYFLIAVGVWNFVGAGIFGFLINMPIVSYFEVGTILTPNHGHAAMMGVFGMLAIALMVFAFREILSDDNWARIEKLVRLSFWGLNVGLALMVVTNLFPGGVLQLIDVLKNGYWHARSPEFLHRPVMQLIEWLRLPGDLIFIGVGIVPLLLAAVQTYRFTRSRSSSMTA